MLRIKQSNSFLKTELFLKKKRTPSRALLEKYGQQGVDALKAATPTDTGKTAQSWYYEIDMSSTHARIVWKNKHRNKGVAIAIILQYGHGTGTGGYVEGIDYINPALKPVFKSLAQEAWKEATKK